MKSFDSALRTEGMLWVVMSRDGCGWSEKRWRAVEKVSASGAEKGEGRRLLGQPLQTNSDGGARMEWNNPRRMAWAQRTSALTVSECLMHEQEAIEMAWLAAGPRLEIPPNGPGHMLGG